MSTTENVQASNPSIFNTGYDLLDGPLNAFFQLQSIKEQTKLYEAQAAQEAVRNQPAVGTQPGADPSLFWSAATAGPLGGTLGQSLLILGVLGVVGFFLVRD